jgi:hypothetical protein
VPDANDRPHLETAASLAIRNVPMLDGALSAGEVRAGLRKKGYESVEAILILDAVGRYDNTASLKDVLAAHDGCSAFVTVSQGLACGGRSWLEHLRDASDGWFRARASGQRRYRLLHTGAGLSCRCRRHPDRGGRGARTIARDAAARPIALGRTRHRHPDRLTTRSPSLSRHLGLVSGSQLASGVGIALFAASSIVSVLGLILPWFLARAGVDPAFGSGPVATIVQDVLTIAIYFVVMTTVISL